MRLPNPPLASGWSTFSSGHHLPRRVALFSESPLAARVAGSRSFGTRSAGTCECATAAGDGARRPCPCLRSDYHSAPSKVRVMQAFGSRPVPSRRGVLSPRRVAVITLPASSGRHRHPPFSRWPTCCAHAQHSAVTVEPPATVLARLIKGRYHLFHGNK